VGVAYVILQALDRAPRLQALCIPLLLVAMAWLTFHQASFWDNDIKVFEHAVQVGYDHSDAYAGLVTAYADRGMSEEQRSAIERWIANTPDSPYRAYYAMFHYQMGQHNYSAAREAFAKAQPGLSDSRVNQGLGMLAMAEGRCVDAERFFRVTTAAHPSVAELHTRLAAALGCQGRRQEALEELKYAWKLRDQATK
jgi:tetratricopeptide (TPR) repeat protein